MNEFSLNDWKKFEKWFSYTIRKEYEPGCRTNEQNYGMLCSKSVSASCGRLHMTRSERV